MLQRVVLNRPGLWSAVSAASVFTSRPSSYLTNSLGKLFPQESELLKPDTNFTRRRAKATPKAFASRQARQANPRESTQTDLLHR